MNRIERIVIVGPSAAGKDVVAERIKLLTGAEIVSTSSQVRKIAGERGLVNPTRGELQTLANIYREEFGDDIFARMALSEIERFSCPVIINGVRNPSEIKVFGQNVLVIGVDAEQSIRFERSLRRGRPSDPKTYEEFLICDQRENGSLNGEGRGQQNLECLKRANAIIRNNIDSLEGLEQAVDTLVDILMQSLELPREIEVRSFKDEKTPLIVLNGPHGAGKTTIGRLMADIFQTVFQAEIGGILRQEVGDNALNSSEEFDREVMRRELLRDYDLRKNDISSPHVVETWHTGNIAYALLRSPGLAIAYLDELIKRLSRFEVFHVLLTISDSTFSSRATEKVETKDREKLLRFYKTIVENTKHLYSKLNLVHMEVENNQGSVEETLQKLLESLKKTIQR